jgi:UDP-N-acetyl-D-glucosamine dehydrogenase
MPADLAVIGLGPFGLPLAQAAVAAGIPTLGYRTGPEPGSLSPAELRRMLSGGFRHATSPGELGRVRTAVICVPTPRGADGTLDLDQVEATARTLAAHLRPHTTVILQSPVPPGTTEEILRPLLEQGSGLRAGRDFHLA